ncbi:UDP-N-acetylenolpyruvoylglucosamine reductase [Campylobacterota bacterium]|nr:UDP-N-acetylenolpyruvoylglucosamine reductase [Campylobacterota bacterium]
MIIDFSVYSSIKIGKKTAVTTIADRSFDAKDFFIVGAASNLLVSNDPPPLAVLDRSFDYCRVEGSAIVCGGGVRSGRVVSLCKQRNLGGLEFLSGLPGTIGGIVAMNAGLKTCAAFDRLLTVDLGNGGVSAETIAHGYRFADLGGVVFEAVFRVDQGFDHALEAEFLRIRSLQPKDKSAGSCFKNPDGDYAGRLIEAVGLKGFQHGGAAFSPQHANFLINNCGATFDDALYLIAEAKRRVSEQFGVALQEEIKII